MAIIATQPVSEEIASDNTQYELWEDKELEQPDGSTVSVKQSIGKFSIARLEQEKTRRAEEITRLQEENDAADLKITAINTLKQDA